MITLWMKKEKSKEQILSLRTFLGEETKGAKGGLILDVEGNAIAKISAR